MSSLIAITVEGPAGLSALLDPRFGRAPVFLLVDPESGEVKETLENQAAEAAHGAGTGAAATMSKHGVDGVISGRFGPKAYEALEALGIGMYLAPKGITAAGALKRLRSGALERMKLQRF